MKVYMKVDEALCNNSKTDCYYCALEDHDKLLDYSLEPEEICSRFDRALGRSCSYCQRTSKTICKSIKSIEIRKRRDPIYPGEVIIGRSSYRLEDTEILKVDYEDGRGFITEWGEED